MNIGVYDLVPAQRADIIRTMIIYENGGMWADASVVFHFNLSWVDNIEKYSKHFTKAG